jgi:hypothetical protein
MGVVSEGLLARGSKLIAGGNRLITHALLPWPFPYRVVKKGGGSGRREGNWEG